jgi:hypothetical protein
MNEADTCRKYVAPRLQAAGWEPYADPFGLILLEKYAADGELHARGLTC